ncbi:Cah Carbonic anhydrase [Burkholderiales bacterium]
MRNTPRTLIAVGLAGMFSLSAASAIAQEPQPLPKPGVQVTPIPAASQEAGKSQVTINSAPANKLAQQAAASGAAPAKGDEAIRQAIRDRMQGQGELVIRTADTPPAAAPGAQANTAVDGATAPAAAKPAPRPQASRPSEPQQIPVTLGSKSSEVTPAKPEPKLPSMPKPVTPVEWAYDGDRGPAMWGKLHPSYTACEKGRFQSPIDVRDGVGVDLPAIRFDFKPSKFRLVDSGKTIEVHYLEGGAVSVMGHYHRLTHIEFRHPAEERINGKSFGMSMQLHLRDMQGRLAAVSVLLVPSGSENPFIQQIWNHIPLVRNEPVAPPDVMLNIADALPKDQAYYTYMGSLTTPPCTEGVTWYVLKNPVAVSAEQIGIFARLYPNNSRPLQASSSRLIKESRGAMPASSTSSQTLAPAPAQ